LEDATRDVVSRTLTVSKSGTGSGTVTSSPSGINCGSDCSHSYNNGTSVTLTASPASGSTFAGWSGACSGTGSCQVSMTSNKSVTAIFNSGQKTLTVTKSGSGSGKVTSSPSGIDCGSDCSESYNQGTSVTLTATPDSGSTFSGWSGGGCSGTGSCRVTMNSNLTVTATFQSQSGQHFTTVWEGSPYNRMNLWVIGAALDEVALEANDEIAIFDGENCVGVGRVESTISNQDPLTITTSQDDDPNDGIANGFIEGQSISFKIWDHSNQTEITHVSSAYFDTDNGDQIDPPSFEGNGDYAVELLAGQDTVTQTISLTTGWNIFSSYTIPEETDLLNIVQPLIDSDRLVKVIDQQGKTILKFFGNWRNNIGDLSSAQGYKIKVTGDTELVLNGSLVDLSEIPLTQGWNIISYPKQNPQSGLGIVQRLIDDEKLVKVSDEKGQTILKFFGSWRNNIGNFEASEGYQLKVNADASLTDTDFSSGSALVTSSPTLTSSQSSHYTPVWSGNPYTGMNLWTIGATINGVDLEANDEIAIFDGENCVGVGVVETTISPNNPLTITSSQDDDPNDGIINGFIEGNEMTIQVWDSSAQKEISIEAPNYLDISGNPIDPPVFEANADYAVSFSQTTEENGVLQFSATEYSVDENGGSVSIEVTRTGGSAGEVTVDYATSDGTATVVDDYTSASGTLTFPDGDTSETFSVTIISDTTVEDDETVNLTLSNPTGGATIGTNNPAELTIVDDDVAGEPDIGVNPGSLNAAQSAETQTTQVLTISNTGGADLDWNIAEAETTCATPGDIPWVSISPASGTTSESGSSTVNVVFDSTGLATDSYAGTLCINSNDPTTPLVEVPVSLQVTGSEMRANDVIIDFGPQYGIWAWMNNASWADIHSLSPMSMVIGDIDGSGQDDLIADFSPSGIWILMNYNNWVFLHGQSANSMTMGDMDGNGQTDVIIDFGSPDGIWIWLNNSTWVKLHTLSPESMTTGDIDGGGMADVIIDFGSLDGIWLWMNNSSWVKLHSLSPESMTTGDMDGNGMADIIIDFGPQYGIWAWKNNNAWDQLHSLSPESMTTGDIDGNGLADVVIDFGSPYGIWGWMNNSTWDQLHTISPDSMTTGYLDNNAQADVVIDFGSPHGIWVRMNNSGWVQLHTISAEGMVTGNIDGLPSVSNSDITTQEGPAELDNAAPLPEAELMSLSTE